VATTPSPVHRIRQATPATTQARPQPPRRPRRWGRLLVLGLTLALVATLGTRALADPDDGGPLVETPDLQTEQLQAQPLPADNPGGTDDAGSAIVTDAASQALTPSGEEHPQSPTVAQAPQPERSDERTEGRDQAGEDVQLADASGCGDGPCSKEPPTKPLTPGNHAVIVPGWPHGEWPFDNFGQPNEHYDRLTPDQKMDLVQRDIGLGDYVIPRLGNTPDRFQVGVYQRILQRAAERLDREVAPHVTPDTPEGRRLTEQRDKLAEQLGQLDRLRNPASVVQVDPSGTQPQGQRPVVQSPTPPHGHAEGARPPELPGTSVTDLKTNPPPVRAMDLAANSALRQRTLTEAAAAALGVDPATVHDASIATSALLLATAGVAWLASYASPQLRLGLLQGMSKGGTKGGLNAVPLMTTDRRVDS